MQCKRRSVCLSCPSRWQRHFGLDWIGLDACAAYVPVIYLSIRHQQTETGTVIHRQARPAGPPRSDRQSQQLVLLATIWHERTLHTSARVAAARLIVHSISRSRNKERRDVWPPRHFRQPRSSPCCLLPGHAKNGSGNRSYQESRRRRPGSGSGSGVARWMESEWMRWPRAACLPSWLG